MTSYLRRGLYKRVTTDTNSSSDIVVSEWRGAEEKKRVTSRQQLYLGPLQVENKDRQPGGGTITNQGEENKPEFVVA